MTFSENRVVGRAKAYENKSFLTFDNVFAVALIAVRLLTGNF